MKRDVIIIGGGAAGLFCAIEAGKRGRSVLVLEHSDRVCKKVAISGGGRCNFTNLHTGPDNFISANPNFCKSALARYTPEDFIALVRKHRIVYHEKKLGQLFCDDSSREIINMLLAECEEAGVEIRLNCLVQKIAKDTLFTLETNRGRLECASLIIATGGLSIAPLGATDFGYRVARQMGLRIRETRPALVPLTFAPRTLDELKALSGVSIDARVSCHDAEFRENILLTHRGMSGPAILQISSYWKKGDVINIDLLPETDALELFSEKQGAEIELANVLGQLLPRRFAHAWCELYGPSRPMKFYSKKELALMASRLHGWQLRPDGTEGYKKAEVTAGGVDTDELSSKTMEARRVPGLYFIGEVLDVTGHLGGYNFQWAWASGYAAGQYA
jgi:predicted Rossmann fold flavoprotein